MPPPVPPAGPAGGFRPQPQPQAQPQPPQPQPQFQPQVQAQPYDFITHPGEPAGGKAFTLPGSNSTGMRAVYVAGGLLVLLIAFLIVKAILNHNPGLATMTGIAQDQQELIHLSTAASGQPSLTTTDQNFAATSQLSVGSSQAAIIKYIVGSGSKLKIKTLNLKVSSSTDAQLASAVTAGIYDQTFKTIMNSELAAYENDLKLAYNGTTDKTKRALFSSDYSQAQLLLTQLNTLPASD